MDTIPANTEPQLSGVKGPASWLPVTGIAAHFDVNRSTVQQWLRRGCPRTSFDDIAAWRSANIRVERVEYDRREELLDVPGKKKKRKATLQEKRIKADTAKIQAEVAYKLMRNQEKRKNLVSLPDVQREAAELAIRIKERLTAAPDEMETRFPAETRATNKSDFEEFIRQLLLELSTWRIAAETLDDHIVTTAAAIQAKRDKT